MSSVKVSLITFLAFVLTSESWLLRRPTSNQSINLRVVSSARLNTMVLSDDANTMVLSDDANTMVLSDDANTMELLHRNSDDIARVRRSARSATSPVPARFVSTMRVKLALHGDGANYIKAAADSNTLSVGPHSREDPQVCFSAHRFNVLSSSSEGGRVVVLEAHGGGRFMHGSSAGPVSLVAVNSGAELTSLTDERFFLQYSEPGDRFDKFRHLLTGLQLSASPSGVSLAPSTGGFTDHMLFEVFPCTH